MPAIMEKSCSKLCAHGLPWNPRRAVLTPRWIISKQKSNDVHSGASELVSRIRPSAFTPVHVAHVAGASVSQNPLKHRFLVAVDLSTGSKEMCSWVMENMYQPGDEIIVVHCVIPFPMEAVYTLPDGRLASINVVQMMEMQDKIEEQMSKTVKHFVDEVFQGNSDVSYLVLNHRELTTMGMKHEIAALLSETAERYGVDGMVVASHSRGGLAEALTGSVAADSARHANVPVVVFHDSKARTQQGSRIARVTRKLEEQITKWLDVATHAYENIRDRREYGDSKTISAAAGQMYANVSLPDNGDDDDGIQDTPGVVTSDDFSDPDDANLIGQTICEIPGLSYDDESMGNLLNESRDHHRIIMVPVDDTDASSSAVSWVSNTVYRKGDVVVLLHMIPSIPSLLQVYMTPAMGVSPASFMLSNSITNDYKESFNRVIEERFAKPLRNAGIDFRSEIILELSDGSSQGIGEAILERADDWNAHMICLGSHTRGGFPEMLLGSVANFVDHNATIPVVVIH